ncbi:MAG: SsrA-binding protein [Thiotrichales bacterium]|nr:SsrA-binding protein [Thiotrichales bacterium]
MAQKKKQASKNGGAFIAQNKKARHDYHLEERFEAGIVLEGWEVKSLRDGRLQLRESYVQIKDGEAWLVGAHISALPTASTHVNPNPTRMRKLLLNKKEISTLIGAVERQGYTVVPISMYWRHGRAKLEIGKAKGKKMHDKRATEKERDWTREKERLLRRN